MREQERRIGLDREMECLPTDQELQARMLAGGNLTPPEFSVLMAYNKTLLKERILDSTVPDESYFYRYLELEFPNRLRNDFSELMKDHRLAREIIATQISNFISVHMGVIFVQRLYDETGAISSEIVKAFVTVAEMFDILELWKNIECYTSKVSSDILQDMMSFIFRFIRRVCRWLLRENRDGINIKAVIDKYKGSANAVLNIISKEIKSNRLPLEIDKYNLYCKAGIKQADALKVLAMKSIFKLMDIVKVSEVSGVSSSEMINLFANLDERLGISWFRNNISNIENDSYWSTLTASALRDDLDRFECQLVASILKHPIASKSVVIKLHNWIEEHSQLVMRWDGMLDDMKGDKPKFVSINIAHRGLSDLVDAGLSDALINK
jgi:glutamate dehydrogenase